MAPVGVFVGAFVDLIVRDDDGISFGATYFDGFVRVAESQHGFGLFSFGVGHFDAPEAGFFREAEMGRGEQRKD